MKILFNTDQIYLHGGIEKVMATKANYFASLPGVEVFVVTTEQEDHPPIYPLDSRIRLIDLGINYNRSQSYFSKGNLRKAVRHYRKQKALFRSLKPDVVISPNFNFDHYWLPFIKGKALLIKERHSSRYAEEEVRRGGSVLQKLRFLVTDFIEKNYDRIVVLNADEQSYVRTGNAVVIPNPIEPSHYRAATENLKVLAAGRISPVKNFGDLIQAWLLVHQEFPEWHLDIYGEDYLGTQASLEALVAQYRLEDVVSFKGSVSDLPKVMADYSIYAMTSETECFPMVLLEALSVGLPVVSYDCPNGPRHILTNGKDGILVAHNNKDAFAEGVRQLMRNSDERKNFQTYAQLHSRRFHTATVMKQWEELIHLPHV